ncbi:hypothetical protein Pelo_14716 [Pelomyxa schiedti]|nr:hypothetical protein Pelo_14716 [Pelomyxa schiedti]
MPGHKGKWSVAEHGTFLDVVAALSLQTVVDPTLEQAQLVARRFTGRSAKSRNIGCTQYTRVEFLLNKNKNKIKIKIKSKSKNKNKMTTMEQQRLQQQCLQAGTRQDLCAEQPAASSQQPEASSKQPAARHSDQNNQNHCATVSGFLLSKNNQSNHTQGIMARSLECINWRDAATSPDVAQYLRKGVLYRGGVIAYCSWESVGSPRTVINLRPEEDDPRAWPQVPALTGWVHLPADAQAERYESTDPVVRDWLHEVLRALADCETPALVHCRSGKDRTGVVVGGLLAALGAPREVIAADWASVPGTDPVNIAMCLDGFMTQRGGGKTHNSANRGGGAKNRGGRGGGNRGGRGGGGNPAPPISLSGCIDMGAYLRDAALVSQLQEKFGTH